MLWISLNMLWEGSKELFFTANSDAAMILLQLVQETNLQTDPSKQQIFTPKSFIREELWNYN